MIVTTLRSGSDKLIRREQSSRGSTLIVTVSLIVLDTRRGCRIALWRRVTLYVLDPRQYILCRGSMNTPRV